MVEGLIDKSLDVNYNLDYLVVVPKKDEEILDAVVFTFGNTILFNNTVEDLECVARFLRNNNVGQLIFVNYYAEYDEIINTLIDEHDIKFIFTKGLGEFSDPCVLAEFNCICNKYDEGSIHEIGFLDPFLYRVVHGKRRNTKQVLLDCGSESTNSLVEEITVGFLNSDSSNYDSFYNELSALTFLPEYTARVMNPSETTVGFAERYGISIKREDSFDKLVANNRCNVYINFAGTDPVVFLKSMDTGVPCVVGNNTFLGNYPELSKFLVMESDDDVNEIAEKIIDCVINRDEILKKYKKFRKDYSKRASRLAEDFLGIKRSSSNAIAYKKLLTVVVPVYNTEKYISSCLDSVIEASVSGMEILVVNDGSTDGGERIIKDYLEKYPDLIRYIKQKNGGLGHVRNVGLLEAKGKYLASVDSDDTIDSEFFKAALPYMKKDIDVIICDWMSASEKESFETAALDHVFNKRKTLEGLLYTTIMPSTCNKIIKSSLFRDNKIEYLEQKYEDLSANPLALLKAHTVKYIRKPYYNYYLRGNSLMRSKIDPREMVDALVYLDKRLATTNETINLEEFKFFTYSWRIEEYIINPLYGLINGIFESEYYTKMLKGLKSKELREYIKGRNEAFKKKKLKEFLKKAQPARELTAGIIYYGD